VGQEGRQAKVQERTTTAGGSPRAPNAAGPTPPARPGSSLGKLKRRVRATRLRSRRRRPCVPGGATGSESADGRRAGTDMEPQRGQPDETSGGREGRPWTILRESRKGQPEMEADARTNHRRVKRRARAHLGVRVEDVAAGNGKAVVGTGFGSRRDNATRRGDRTAGPTLCSTRNSRPPHRHSVVPPKPSKEVRGGTPDAEYARRPRVHAPRPRDCRRHGRAGTGTRRPRRPPRSPDGRICFTDHSRTGYRRWSHGGHQARYGRPRRS